MMSPTTVSASAAGPSKPRKLSQSSSLASPTSPTRTKLRTSNDNLPTSHIDNGAVNDDDEDDLPGYTAPVLGGEPNGGPSRTSHSRSGSKSGLLRDGEILRDSMLEDGGPIVGGANAAHSDREALRSSAFGEEQSMPIGLEMSLAQRKIKWWRDTIITGIFVIAWYGSATLLSIYNKWMFSPQYYNFPFPLFVTGCHMVVQFCLSSAVRNIWKERYRPPERPTRQDYVGKILPTAISTAGDIGLSNLSLRIITLSLYTMCKSSALIFVLLFAFLFRLERFSLQLISVICLISVGVFFMVYDVTAVNIPGIIMVFTASALSGLRWGLTELLMKRKKMGLSNPFATIFWLAPLMAVVLLPISAGIEGWGEVFGNGHWAGGQALFTTGVIALPGVIAFTMVASEYFSTSFSFGIHCTFMHGISRNPLRARETKANMGSIIDRAGILPLSVAGVFKEVTTISFSAWIFGDELTELNIVGVAIAVCGIALYAYYKYRKAISSPHQHTEPDDRAPLVSSSHSRSHSQPTNRYALAADEPDAELLASPLTSGVPMAQLASSSSKDHAYPPATDRAPGLTEEERVQKRIDDFEGWNDNWGEDDGASEDEDEVDEEEVLKRRGERVGSDSEGGKGGRLWNKSWGMWWQKEM